MKQYFQLDENVIHLNHAAVGPWPVATRDTVIAFANENAQIGSQRYAQWMKTEQQLKQKMATLVKAESTDEIAILKNTSEGLSLIAQGLRFNAGDNIVIPAEEFPSNKVVWQALAPQGVEVRLVSIESSATPEQDLINAMDDNTRLLSCSSVQFARGLRLNLEMIGEACRSNDTLFCVDAIQSLGAIEFDAQACHADFVVADGHKWMCAPEGTALFYCRQSHLDQLSLHQHGWHMLKDAFSFSHQESPLALADRIVTSAQRFECGSPNMCGIAALNTSLGLLLDIGLNEIEKQVIDIAQYTIQKLSNIDSIQILSPTDPSRHAGIVNFVKSDCDLNSLFEHLQDNNVLCAQRGGGIRFSPHFHTTHHSIDKAVNLVASYQQ